MKKNMLNIICVILILTAVLSGCSKTAGTVNTSPDISGTNTYYNSTSTPAVTLSPTESPLNQQEEPLFTKLDPYFLEPDIKASIKPETYEYYKILVDGILQRKEVIELSDNFEDNLYCVTIFQSHPYNFLIKEFTYENKESQNMHFTYSYTSDEQKEIIEYIETEYLEILNSIIGKEYNDLEKTLAIYRYFGRRVDYNYQWLYDMQNADDPFYPGIEIYEALKTNKGVCHSYSFLCTYALYQVGVDAFNILGTSASNEDNYHMWVMVDIDGEYYHIDPTWDGEKGGEALRYFGLTDYERVESGIIMSEFSSSHDIDFGNIQCTSKTFDLFKDVVSWEFTENHKIKLNMRNGSTVIYDTKLKKVV